MACVSAILSLAFVAEAQTPPAALDLVPLRTNFAMLAGAGGNIAVQTGADGIVLVNSGNLQSAGEVLATLRKLSDQPIRYIINTNADPDLVGGNGVLSRAGRNIFAAGTEPVGGDFGKAMTNGYAATILACQQALMRMSAPTGQTARFTQDSWPTETFFGIRKYIYLNHEGIETFHVPAAHSDSDSITFFRASDIIVAGDVLDATRFPVIDLDNGGSLQGEIRALNRIIELSVRPIPFVFEGGGTYIIPAHGHVLELTEVVDYRDMLVIIRDIVQDMIKSGLTLVQIEAADPAKAYRRAFGSDSGAWTTRDFVKAVYLSLTRIDSQ